MLVVLLCLEAVAADLYVGPSQVHPTLADAVAASADGDRILLVPGTHVVDAITLPHDLTIRGLGGWAATTLDVEALETGIFVDFDVTVGIEHVTFQMNGTNRGLSSSFGTEVILDSVVFLDGGFTNGACARLGSEGSLRNVRFERCEASGLPGAASGGGLLSDGQGVSIDSATFTDNDAWTGGGLACTGFCEVERSLFIGNDASNGGAIATSGQLDIRTSRLCANVAGDGGAIWLNEADLDVDHSVFWDNDAVNGGAIFAEGAFNNAPISSSHVLWGYNGGDTAILAGHDDHNLFVHDIIMQHTQLFASQRVSSHDNDWTFTNFVNYQNPGGLVGGPAIFVDRTGEITDNPSIANNTRNTCAPESFFLQAGSPAIDAGSDSDTDGSDGDLGPFGGPDPWMDVDGDGFFAPEDCDDDDANVYPGASESCDGVDSDCDGLIDDGLAEADHFVDSDGDGFGGGTPIALCGPRDGLVADGGDCDDASQTANPDATELCNGLDDDCDGTLDNGLTQSDFFPDADGDGYGEGTAISACAAPDGYAEFDGDCDDDDDEYNPGAAENDCSDPNDYNCDGSVGFADNDSDGFAACEECDDTDAGVNPDANETCDGVDQDCNGVVDDNAIDAIELAQDDDRDGYGNPDVLEQQCEGASGWVDDRADCDDTNPAISPDAEEILDNDIDENCDGVAATSDGSDPAPGCTGCNQGQAPSPAWLMLIGALGLRRRRALPGRVPRR